MSRVIVVRRPVLIKIPKIIIDRTNWVKYLSDGWMLEKDKAADMLLHKITSEKFNNFLYEQLTNYIYEQKPPPAEIATAVMNVADDILSERDPVIRTGDYIQLQNYLRKNRIL